MMICPLKSETTKESCDLWTFILYPSGQQLQVQTLAVPQTRAPIARKACFISPCSLRIRATRNFLFMRRAQAGLCSRILTLKWRKNSSISASMTTDPQFAFQPQTKSLDFQVRLESDNPWSLHILSEPWEYP